MNLTERLLNLQVLKDLSSAKHENRNQSGCWKAYQRPDWKVIEWDKEDKEDEEMGFEKKEKTKGIVG